MVGLVGVIILLLFSCFPAGRVGPSLIIVISLFCNLCFTWCNLSSPSGYYKGFCLVSPKNEVVDVWRCHANINIYSGGDAIPPVTFKKLK
jgi:hypothetical protein